MSRGSEKFDAFVTLLAWRLRHDPPSECPSSMFDIVMPLFNKEWDVGPALSIALNRDIAGDIATDRMRIGRTGLETSLYGERTSYPFGPTLFVYRPYEHRVVQLATASAADVVFVDLPRMRCPISYPGQGELI